MIIGAWLIPTGNQAGAAAGVIDTLVSPAKGHSGTLVRLFHNVDAQKGANLHSFGDFLTITGSRLPSRSHGTSTWTGPAFSVNTAYGRVPGY